MRVSDFFFRSTIAWRLYEILGSNLTRFGPAGIKGTDVPKLLEALDKALEFIDDSHQWSEDTFLTLQKQTLEEIRGILTRSTDGNP